LSYHIRRFYLGQNWTTCAKFDIYIHWRGRKTTDPIWFIGLGIGVSGQLRPRSRLGSLRFSPAINSPDSSRLVKGYIPVVYIGVRTYRLNGFITDFYCRSPASQVAWQAAANHYWLRGPIGAVSMSLLQK